MIIPKIFNHVTGLPRTNNDTDITNIRLLLLATAYVNGVTNEITLNAIIFCNQFKTPSVNNKAITLYSPEV